MPSRLPEHALVTLLRQCFVTPTCQLPRRYSQVALPSSRSTGTARAYQPRQRSPAIREQNRGYHTHNGQFNVSRASSTTSFGFSGYAENSLQARRRKSTTRTLEQPREGEISIAVLGGGVSGLASAHYLTRELPHAKITIYEESDRLGGWLNSRQVNVKQGDIVFEQGPRSLRPNTPASLVTLDMIRNLHLEDQLLITPQSSVAAQNRFVYYPDHLVKMPGPGQDFTSMLWNLISEPVFKGLMKGSLFEFNQPPRSAALEDESVGSFLNRRLGSPRPGNNIVSAVLHGIYAGDIYQLSVKSLLPSAWHQEGTYGSISEAILKTTVDGKKFMSSKDAQIQQSLGGEDRKALTDRFRRASVYTFKGGLGTFSDVLGASLKANKNVQIRLGQKIEEVDHDGGSDSILVKTTSNHPPTRYTHCISTLPAHILGSATPHLPTLKDIHSVTVMVVNLYYANPDVLPEAGFGYLIPRSIPFDQNPECALGVVFDSYSSVGQDTAPGTKLTVMLGGHWWDSFSEYPTEDEGAEMAKAVLRRHLNINEEPEKVLVGLQSKCIPQYTVGHEERLRKVHGELTTAFKGRLSVAGNWIDGVGLNDCVRGARDVVMSLKGDSGQNINENGVTGLEEFQGPRVWVETKTAAYKAYEARKGR